MKKWVVLSVCLLALEQATAKTQLNAMCFIEKDKAPQAFTPTADELKDLKKAGVIESSTSDEEIREKFRIASLTKILTTHWAVLKLGPYYRFQTQFHVAQDSKKNCSVHISGDMDPYFGFEMMDQSWKQLSLNAASMGCKEITAVTTDNKFRLKLDIFDYRLKGKRKLAWMNPQFGASFKSAFNSLTNYLSKNRHRTVSTDRVSELSTDDFKKANVKNITKTYVAKSRPLFMMLKDFNKVSYNYPPEVLFERLGGAQAYVGFLSSRIKIPANEVEVFNGSGYPIFVAGQKRYNLTSCSMMTLVLRDLDYVLKGITFEPLQLADVMGVGGSGETWTTFKSAYSGNKFNNTIVGKTGTANEAITFAGMFSILTGKVYFAVLTAPLTTANEARGDIKHLVDTLVDRYTLSPFDYKQAGDMAPVDRYTQLVEVLPGGTVASATN